MDSSCTPVSIIKLLWSAELSTSECCEEGHLKDFGMWVNWHFRHTCMDSQLMGWLVLLHSTSILSQGCMFVFNCGRDTLPFMPWSLNGGCRDKQPVCKKTMINRKKSVKWGLWLDPGTHKFQSTVVSLNLSFPTTMHYDQLYWKLGLEYWQGHFCPLKILVRMQPYPPYANLHSCTYNVSLHMEITIFHIHYITTWKKQMN